MAEDNQGTGTGEGTGTGAGEGTGNGGEWTPPTREEWEAHQRKLSDTETKLTAANKEAANRRGELSKLKQQHETDAEKTAREAQEAATALLRPKVLGLTGQLAAAFKEARPERLGSLVKLVDFTNVDLDTLSGLDAEVTRLRTEFPEFFTAGDGQGQGQQQGAGGRVQMGGRKPAGGGALSPLDQLAQQIQGAQQ